MTFHEKSIFVKGLLRVQGVQILCNDLAQNKQQAIAEIVLTWLTHICLIEPNSCNIPTNQTIPKQIENRTLR